jgi:hypothetical protein
MRDTDAAMIATCSAVAIALHDGRATMKHLTTLLALSFALTVAACGKGAGVDNIVKLKDEACACKDKACAEATNKKLDEAMAQLEKDLGGKEPDEATTKKLMSAMTEAGVCIAKLTK